MKNGWLVLLMLLSAAVFAAGGKGKMGLGDKAALTNVKMTDVNGKTYSLEDVKKENGVLVLFSSNACPFVLQWEGRYPELKEFAEKHGVGMIVLNSNHQNREGIDSFEAMKKHAAEKGYNFPYVVDENSQLANAFGGQTTPHAFLFNGKMELVYKGAIDDNYKSATEVKNSYLKDAIASVSSGETVVVAETKPVGCSIKRKLD